MKKLIGLAAILLSTVSYDASAHRTDWTTVQRLLTVENELGGCMARLAVDMRQVSGNECGEWVSFSCTHELLDADTSNRLWDSIQLAYVMKKAIRVQVDPNRKHNGHCVARRIDFQ
jgi:hypothetical protein